MKKFILALAALAFLATPALAIVEPGKRTADWFVCTTEADAQLVFDKAKSDGVDASYPVWESQAALGKCRVFPGLPGEIVRVIEVFEIPEQSLRLYRLEVTLGSMTVWAIMGEKMEAVVLPGA